MANHGMIGKNYLTPPIPDYIKKTAALSETQYQRNKRALHIRHTCPKASPFNPPRGLVRHLQSDLWLLVMGVKI